MATVNELGALKSGGAEAPARASSKQTLFELKNKASTGVLDSTAKLDEDPPRGGSRASTVARAKDLAATAAKAKE